MLAKRRSEQLLTVPWKRDGFLPRPPKCQHLALPSVVSPRRPPCAVPTRPARCVSGFWTRQVHPASDWEHMRKFHPSFPHLINRTCRTQNADIPQAGRVGAPTGAARRDRARLGANRLVRPKKNTAPSKASKKHFQKKHRRKSNKLIPFLNCRMKKTGL